MLISILLPLVACLQDEKPSAMVMRIVCRRRV